MENGLHSWIIPWILYLQLQTSFLVMLLPFFKLFFLGLKGYKPVEIVKEPPQFVVAKYKTKKTAQESKSICRAIFAEGVLYCVRQREIDQVCDRAIAFSPEENVKIKDFIVWQRSLTLENIFYYAYDFYSCATNWFGLWGGCSLDCSLYSWRKDLTRAITLSLSSFDYFGTFNCRLEATIQNPTNTEIFFQEKRIASLTNIPYQSNILFVLETLLKQVELHILEEESKVFNLRNILNAMLKGRVRFISKSRNNLRNPEYSFGELRCLDKTKQWIDPFVLIKEIFQIDGISLLIWDFFIDEVQYNQRHRQALLKHAVSDQIEIWPHIEIVNFDSQFHGDIGYVEHCDLQTRTIKTEFRPYQVNYFEPIEVVQRFQSTKIPRRLEFLHEVIFYPIHRHRSDIRFVQMYLYNCVIIDINAYISVQNKRYHSGFYCDSEIILQGFGLMWKRPKTKTLIEKYEFQFGKMKGVINENTLLQFLLNECEFLGENHFDCIRNLRFGLENDFSNCQDCRFKKFAIMFQFGLDTGFHLLDK